MPAAAGGGKEEAGRDECGRNGKANGKVAESCSSIYTSSHSRLPETGAFPSKPGIDTAADEL